MRFLPLAMLLGSTPVLLAADKPPLDQAQPSKIETATFAMG